MGNEHLGQYSEDTPAQNAHVQDDLRAVVPIPFADHMGKRIRLAKHDVQYSEIL